MRAVVQRVNNAEVTVDEDVVGQIEKGLLVFVGVGHDDAPCDIKYLADKIINLRIFSDADGKMNLSINDIKGDFLVVSQFTLYGDCRKGRRPSYSDAALPDKAQQYYKRFIELLSDSGFRVETGCFQVHMKVSLENDGPVTLLLDSNKQF